VASIYVNVVDDDYPDCFHDTDLAISVTIKVTENPKYNHLGVVIAAGLTMTTIVIATSLAFAAWTIFNRKSRAVRASQPEFLVAICFGTLVMGLAIIPLGIDDGNASQLRCDISCMSVPWLVSSGFTRICCAI